jgi:hypothetical protein
MGLFYLLFSQVGFFIHASLQTPQFENKVRPIIASRKGETEKALSQGKGGSTGKGPTQKGPPQPEEPWAAA